MAPKTVDEGSEASGNEADDGDWTIETSVV
jgi:hypothetical protein